MKSDGRDNTSNLVQFYLKKSTQGKVGLSCTNTENNNKVQHRKLTKEYTNCCMLHKHVLFTYGMFFGTTVNVQE